MTRDAQFWLTSITFSILALFLFGVGTAFSKEEIKSNTVIFTFANVAYMAGVLFQAYFCRSLNTKISSQFLFIGFIFLGIFGLHFEYLRGSGQFIERVLEVAILSSAILIWQFIELYRLVRRDKSLQLVFLALCTLIELGLVILRVAISATQVNPVQIIGDIPFLLIAILWLHIIFNTLSYLTMSGYWAEQSSARRTALRIENERISALLFERDALIKSLLRANKTAAAGALSASIVHELNQPLGATHINLFTLKMLLNENSVPKDRALEIVDSINADTIRSAQIITALRRLFEQSNSAQVQVNLAQVVDEVVRLVKSECISKKIILDVVIDSGLKVAIGNIELHQVMLNLVTNAIHAVDKAEGIQTISIRANTSNQNVEISVTDSGVGIAPDRVASIFELLSTDKVEGLGLGLWLSRFIVERYHGKIWHEGPVSWGTNRGARFVVSLPISLAAISSEG